MQDRFPELVWEQKPRIAVYCLPLHYFTNKNPLIQGAIVIARLEGGKTNWHAPGLEEKYIPEVKIHLREDISDAFKHTLQIYTSLHRSPDAEISFEKQVIPALESELRQLNESFMDTFNPGNLHQTLRAASILNYRGKLEPAIRAYNVISIGSPLYTLPELFKQLPWFECWFNQYISRKYYGQGICAIAHNGIYVNEFSPLF